MARRRDPTAAPAGGGSTVPTGHRCRGGSGCDQSGDDAARRAPGDDLRGCHILCPGTDPAGRRTDPPAEPRTGPLATRPVRPSPVCLLVAPLSDGRVSRSTLIRVSRLAVNRSGRRERRTRLRSVSHATTPLPRTGRRPEKRTADPTPWSRRRPFRVADRTTARSTRRPPDGCFDWLVGTARTRVVVGLTGRRPFGSADPTRSR